MHALDPRRVKDLIAVLDLLVESLGEPSCPLRRAIVLNDIYAHPQSSLRDIMLRLDLDKSTAFRDVDWLVEHGCVIRRANAENAREVDLFVFEKTAKFLERAFVITGGIAPLNAILQGFIDLSPERKQSFREAKLLLSLTLYGKIDRSDIRGAMFDGPQTTDARALQNLINEGFVIDNGS